jgi:putative transcriptional regulator
LPLYRPPFRREPRQPALRDLQAVAEGTGPGNLLVSLGYAGWDAGQLEAELIANAWLTCPADASILFDLPFDQRLNAAAARLGVNLSLLTSQAGHA